MLRMSNLKTRDLIEPVTAVVISLSVLATSFASYEARLWSGEQARHYGLAGLIEPSLHVRRWRLAKRVASKSTCSVRGWTRSIRATKNLRRSIGHAFRRA